MAQLLPIFPLHVVIFPRTRLPLHIFEDRYKEMVGDAIRDRSEFGIVLAKDRGIVNAGCTAVVDKVLEMHPDGRMEIVTRGERRFEIVSLNEEKDYLQAEVTYFDDEDPEQTPEDVKAATLEQYHQLTELGLESSEQPDLEDRQLSFQLAQALPDLDFLAVLLRTRSEPTRLRELNQYLTRYIPRRRSIQRMKQLAPTNGHGTRPAGL